MKATEATYKLMAQLAQLCVEHGITRAVLCPGSRSAPLALSFMRNAAITHYILPDERSAAYTALGMAQSLQKPVVLICTSGTAAINFFPAVAEAFFNNIPLLILTADRPPEWLGQADNQAIFQQGIYGKHVKASYNFPVDVEHTDARWFALRQANEAINYCFTAEFGPVHINIPLREPLYLSEPQNIDSESVTATKIFKPEVFFPEALYAEINTFKKVAVVAGTFAPNEKLVEILNNLTEKTGSILLPDITSNLTGVKNAFPFAELIIDSLNETELADFEPELIISFGGPIVSKTLKNFLRKTKAAHWHLGFNISAPDTFQKLNRILPVEPEAFFSRVIYGIPDQDYKNNWHKKQTDVLGKLPEIFQNIPFSEIKAVKKIFDAQPENSVLHLGNSLPVRYASVFPVLTENIAVYANRGTSGIDGSLSTAAGHSIAQTNKIHTLIVGDLSFIYDSNGLWDNYLSNNFKIIVLNNHGGGIFRNLPGSASQAELEEYFVVKQPLTMEHLAKQFNCHYIYCNAEKCLDESLQQLFSASGKPAILEIEFDNYLKISEVKALLK